MYGSLLANSEFELPEVRPLGTSPSRDQARGIGMGSAPASGLAHFPC